MQKIKRKGIKRNEKVNFDYVKHQIKCHDELISKNIY